MTRAILATLTLALAACTDHPPPSTPMPDGHATVAPWGWTDYCTRHISDDPRCHPSN